MSAVLKRAPSAEAFASAWVEHVLEPALPLAAGKDRRLSAKEAGRAAKVTEGPLALAGETLEAIRTLTGSARPSVQALKNAGETFARTHAEEAAGPDGKLSLADGKKLPAGLDRGFLALRGRGDAPAPKAPDLGVISDIDKTVLPPSPEGSLSAPYPGVVVLFRELDLAADDELDATYYVTARSADRISDIPDWLAEHELPSMGISTGIGPQPWIAEPEKVKDILEIMDANPGQRFVLFGDTSHRDPEVYKKVLAQRPEQVAAAIIHKVTPNVSAERVEGLNLVENYAEAAAVLHHQGLLSKHSARKVIAAARAQGLDLTAAQGDALLQKS